MATFENTVMIRRPIADVFAFLADFENIPKWNYAIVETHKVSEGPIGVGTIYRQVRSVPSRSEERFEVTAPLIVARVDGRRRGARLESRPSVTPCHTPARSSRHDASHASAWGAQAVGRWFCAGATAS